MSAGPLVDGEREGGRDGEIGGWRDAHHTGMVEIVVDPCAGTDRWEGDLVHSLGLIWREDPTT